MVFFSTPVQPEKKISFLDEKDSINTYLHNLIFEFFARFHFMCLVFLIVGQFPDGTVPRLPLPRGQIPDWHFPDGHFPDGHFPDGHFPNGHFPERTIPWPDTSPKDTSPTGHFPTKTFPRTDISRLKRIFKFLHFLGKLFVKANGLDFPFFLSDILSIHFIYTHVMYKSFNLLNITCQCSAIIFS